MHILESLNQNYLQMHRKKQQQYNKSYFNSAQLVGQTGF